MSRTSDVSTSVSLASRVTCILADISFSTIERVSSPPTGPSLTPVTVIVTVAVSVPPLPSLVAYKIVVSSVSPTAKDSKSPLASKTIEPSELIVNRPPVEPDVAPPTLPPDIADTLSTSPVSISLSAPLPLSFNTFAL